MISRIFSIEEFSVYDGPGIRTTVFFSGCPLNCNWCHSPEGKSLNIISLKNPNGCLHCNRCIDVCPTKRLNCIGCGKCIDVCPRSLIRMSAIDYDNVQLAEKLLRNSNILNANGGGITFSGGDPLYQHESLYDLILKLKGKVHLAIQTEGYCDSDIFKKIISKIDLVLYDMKIINKDLAQKYEGVDNTLILQNLKILKESNVPFIIRIPLIPGVIDTEKNMKEIISLIKGSKNMIMVEMLPYNKYAGSKYKLVGLEYKPMFDESIPSNPHLDLFAKENIKARVL